MKNVQLLGGTEPDPAHAAIKRAHAQTPPPLTPPRLLLCRPCTCCRPAGRTGERPARGPRTRLDACTRKHHQPSTHPAPAAAPQEVTTETRRVAELLAQLPADVDVEGMVTRVLQAPGGPLASTAVVPAALGQAAGGGGPRFGMSGEGTAVRGGNQRGSDAGVGFKAGPGGALRGSGPIAEGSGLVLSGRFRHSPSTVVPVADVV
jgi:hypothetical protein